MSIFSDNVTNQVPQEVLAEFIKKWIDKNFQYLWNSKRGNLENIVKSFNSTLKLHRTREFCEKYNAYHPWMVINPVVDESMMGKLLITVMYFTTKIYSIKWHRYQYLDRSILLQYKVPFPSSKF